MTDTEGRKYALDEKGEARKGVFTLTPSIIIGDVNGDTSVNASDAASILIAAAISGASTDVTAQQSLFTKDPTRFKSAEDALAYADANGDGIVNAKDATEILIYAAHFGADSTTPAIGSARYFAGSDGFIQTGLIKDEATGDSYYAGEDGKLQTGWQTVKIGDAEEQRFFLADGRMAVSQNVTAPDGKTVWVNENGAVPKNGFFDSEAGRYYQDANGQRVTGIQTIDGKTYYFNADGILQKGFITADGKTYYADEDGTLRAGLIKVGEDTYYFDPATFAMEVNAQFRFEDGERSFGADGKMIRGWVTYDTNTYYYNENGIKVAGKTQINGLWYYFDANGVNKTGWIEDNGVRYCADLTDRHLLTGWQKLDGFNYYFNEDGSMAVSTIVEGKTVQADGKVMSDTLYAATTVILNDLERYTKNPEGIYQYMRDTNRYKNTEPTKTLEELNNYGWGTLVTDAVNTHYVVCYYLAAKMDYILKICGYNSRIVHATHSSGDHYWNQVEMPGGVWVDYDPTNYGWKGYSWDQIMQVGNFTFLGYVFPDYY
jgi:glucan-binding repeat-containing protein